MNTKNDIDKFFEEIDINDLLRFDEITGTSPSTSRHAQPITDTDVSDNIMKQIPKSTLNSANWAQKTFDDWLGERNRKILEAGSSELMYLSEEGFATLGTMSKGSLNSALQKFVFEVRKVNGDRYPSETLRSLVCGIGSWLQRVEKKQWRLFSDPDFADARTALDAAMKVTGELNVNQPKKRASPITEQQEESLWERGYLGIDNPKKLNRTLIYLLAIHLGLRGGKEIRELTVGPESELQLRKIDDQEVLEYNEKVSKTKRCGLKDRNVDPKRVKIYPITDRSRCTVQIYKTMIEKRPQNCVTTALFLQSHSHYSNVRWYLSSPMGHNTLDMTFRTIMEAAGEDDRHYSNQSGRRTTVTRIIEKTGKSMKP